MYTPIIKEDVEELNATLKVLQCSFRLRYNENSGEMSDVSIIPANNLFIKYAEIYPSDEFYSILENYFQDKGITLGYSNTRQRFWSKHE